MFTGPGSWSMMNAAVAWEGLAASLNSAAAHYISVTSKLNPATTVYPEWLNYIAAQAERTAAQAKSAAGAFQLALAAMVPPAAIQANRMLWTWLAKTNYLGQSGPAIAKADSDCDQIWAQDGDAMYVYARACADAARVTPFASPPQAGRGGREQRVAPDVISTGRQVISAIPHALDALWAAPPTTFDVCLLPVTSSLSKLGSLCAPSDFAINHLNSRNKRAALKRAATLSARLPNRSRGAVSGLGRAASIGPLSVPRSWIAKTPRPVPASRGWCYEPMHLVATGEPPKWPQTR